MKVILVALASIPIIALTVILFNDGFQHEASTYRFIDWASIVGLILTYLGFLFSLYAAVMVRDLSQRHFLKRRLPELQRQADELVSSLSSLSGLARQDFRARPEYHGIPAFVKSLRNVPKHKLETELAAVEEQYGSLKTWLEIPKAGALLQDANAFWGLVEAVGVVAEGIKGFLAEEGAR